MADASSICWECRRVWDCLHATAKVPVVCLDYEQKPMPPGPKRAPSKELSRKLWANTPKERSPEEQVEIDATAARLEAVVTTSKNFRETLIRCSQVGWPVDVQVAFYAWQNALNALAAPGGQDVT